MMMCDFSSVASDVRMITTNDRQAFELILNTILITFEYTHKATPICSEDGSMGWPESLAIDCCYHSYIARD